MQMRRKRFRYLRRVKSLANMRSWMSGQRAPQDGICSMALSPDGSLMITLHWSGRFSVWECPSLKLVQTWELDQQVCCRWSLPLPEFLVLRNINVAYFLFAAELRRVEHFDQRKPGETTHDARTPARALAGRRQLVVKQGKQNEMISLICDNCVVTCCFSSLGSYFGERNRRFECLSSF